MNNKKLENLPIHAIIKTIDGKYKILIIALLLERIHRYSELQKKIPCSSAKILTQQLRELESDEIISRKIYPEVPPKVEYSLTEFGQKFHPLITLLNELGSEYLQLIKTKKDINSNHKLS